jgi:hypothetical protein
MTKHIFGGRCEDDERTALERERKIIALDEYRRQRRSDDDPGPPYCPRAARPAHLPLLTLAIAESRQGSPSLGRRAGARACGLKWERRWPLDRIRKQASARFRR